MANGDGINYGSASDKDAGFASKLLPFNENASAWWKPGESEWLFGGGATKGMLTQPQTGDYQRGYLQNDFMKRGPVQVDAYQSNQTREQQQQLAQMLQAQASGQKAGAGEMAVNRQVGQAQAQQTAQASMARGANSALAARNAARMQSDIGVNGAGMAAQAQMQDQQGARNQLAGLLGTQRQQDIGLAQGNQQAAMQQQQLQLAALAQMLGVDKAALEQDLKKREIDAADKGNAGALMQGFGGMMTASDERAKHSVFDADADVDEVLLHLKPKRYYYKDPAKHGEGERVGVMAQDLEQSFAGAEVVAEIDGVKHIDVPRAVSLLLAIVARQDARIRELEGK